MKKTIIFALLFSSLIVNASASRAFECHERDTPRFSALRIAVVAATLSCFLPPVYAGKFDHARKLADMEISAARVNNQLLHKTAVTLSHMDDMKNTKCPERDNYVAQFTQATWSTAHDAVGQLSGIAMLLYSRASPAQKTFIRLGDFFERSNGKAAAKLYRLYKEAQGGSLVAAHRLGQNLNKLSDRICSTPSWGASECLTLDDLKFLSQALCATQHLR